MTAMANMSGIVADEEGQGMGAAITAARSSPTQASGSGASDDAKPYLQNHLATLLGFSWRIQCRLPQECMALIQVYQGTNI